MNPYISIEKEKDRIHGFLNTKRINGLYIYILRNKHMHTREKERGSNTKANHNSTQKPW